MKILETAKALARTLTVDLEKRNGVFVYRPVENGEEWHAWAVKHGVPSPIPAAELHVTIMHSTVDVKMVPDTRPQVIETAGWCPGHFCLLGPAENVLTFCFDGWELHDRNWAFQRNGAQTKWPTFRPHMSITMDIGDYELTDEALADAPRYIILGGEKYKPIKSDEPVLVDDQDPEGDGESPELIIVIEIAASAAAEALKSEAPDFNIPERMALRDISARKTVALPVLKRLAANEKTPQAIKDLVKADAPKTIVEIAGKKYEERDLTMTVAPLSEDIRKKLTKDIDAFKYNEEEKLAYGWASVATVKGVDVEDLQGDTITTKAQRQWLHSLIKGQRFGLMEHEGEPIAEVVEGIVFDADLQKALGIDLGMEGVLTCTHYICEKTWGLVKSGDWMHSIAGRVLIEVEE